MVWQDGTELRRDIISLTLRFDAFVSEAGDKFLTAATLDFLRGGRDLFTEETFPVVRPYGASGAKAVGGRFPLDGVHVELDPHELALGAYRSWEAVKVADNDAGHRVYVSPGGNRYPTQYESAITRHQAAMAGLEAQVTSYGVTLADLTDQFFGQLRDEKELRDRHQETVRALSALPQLFIAV